MVRQYASLLIILATCSCASTRPGLLWEITGPHAKDTSYLFGTFHVMKGGFVDTMTSVRARLERSDAVVGEMVMDMSDLRSGAAQMISPTPLNKLLSPSEYALVDSVFRVVTGSGLGFFNMFKPMAASAQLAKSMFEGSGLILADPNDPVLDLYFQEQGRTLHKQLIGLETMEEQMEILFGGFSLERQARMLVEMATDLDRSHVEMRQITRCYLEEDLDCIAELGDGTAGGLTEEEMHSLVRARNDRWIQKLLEILPTQRAFIAVGALHLPGDDGLIKLLRDRGYQLRSIPLH